MSDAVMLKELVTALSTLKSLGEAISTPILMTDVFPSTDLEVLCIPPDAHIHPVARSDPREMNVSKRALEAIGIAMSAALDAAGDDTARLETDDGMHVLIFRPEARRTVVQATGVSLLPI